MSADSIPQELKEGYLIPIFKKGNKKLYSNYTEICVTSPIIKNIRRRILRNRLEEEYEGIEEQRAFHRSCVEQIFTLRQILEKQREKGKSTELVFVDLEKLMTAYRKVCFGKY